MNEPAPPVGVLAGRVELRDVAWRAQIATPAGCARDPAQRAALRTKGVPVGDSLLFFGCRDPLQDFLREEELRGFKEAGVTRLHAVVPREPGKPKACVQQAIREQGEAVWRLIRQEAVIFVWGDASRMAPAVRQALADVFRGRTGAPEGDAQAWPTGLVAGRRTLEDIRASAA